jgi:hypothetical protein
MYCLYTRIVLVLAVRVRSVQPTESLYAGLFGAIHQQSLWIAGST